jgi:hypothetical protein
MTPEPQSTHRAIVCSEDGDGLAAALKAAETLDRWRSVDDYAAGKEVEEISAPDNCCEAFVTADTEQAARTMVETALSGMSATATIASVDEIEREQQQTTG